MSDYFRIIKKYLPPVQVRCQTFVGSFKGDKNRVSGMVLVDCCKAFDMVAHKDFVSRLSHGCHIDIDRDVSTAYCKSSSGDSAVDSLSRTICTTVVVSDWCIAILA